MVKDVESFVMGGGAVGATPVTDEFAFVVSTIVMKNGYSNISLERVGRGTLVNDSQDRGLTSLSYVG